MPHRTLFELTSDKGDDASPPGTEDRLRLRKEKVGLRVFAAGRLNRGEGSGEDEGDERAASLLLWDCSEDTLVVLPESTAAKDWRMAYSKFFWASNLSCSTMRLFFVDGCVLLSFRP